jgi:hypothetical protein
MRDNDNQYMIALYEYNGLDEIRISALRVQQCISALRVQSCISALRVQSCILPFHLDSLDNIHARGHFAKHRVRRI